METLYDMHCHLGFVANAAEAAAIARRAQVAAFSCTVTPEEFAQRETANVAGEGACRSQDASSIVWGLGLHPWYVAEDWGAQVAAFEALVPRAAAFGELGLDFSARHQGTAEAQVAAFERLLHVIVDETKKRAIPPLLSLHAVHAADAVLELLRKTGALDTCRVVFHWFSGSGEELLAARDAGCYFSVGPHMLASRRGRAYGAQIPAERLLLETDEPPEGAVMSGETWRAQLEDALRQLAALRRTDAAELQQAIAKTSRELLGVL